MTEYLWDKELVGGLAKDVDIDGLKTPYLFIEYVEAVRRELMDSVNARISETYGFTAGNAAIMYCGGVAGFARRIKGETRDRELRIMEVAAAVERQFIKEFSAPYPDLAKEFDKNIF